MTDHPDHTEVHFCGPHFTGLALVEEPLRDTEQLHGWEYIRQPDQDGLPWYVATGHRAEWVKPKEFGSRSEKRMGKLNYGESGD